GIGRAADRHRDSPAKTKIADAKRQGDDRDDRDGNRRDNIIIEVRAGFQTPPFDILNRLKRRARRGTCQKNLQSSIAAPDIDLIQEQSGYEESALIRQEQFLQDMRVDAKFVREGE